MWPQQDSGVTTCGSQAQLVAAEAKGQEVYTGKGKYNAS